MKMATPALNSLRTLTQGLGLWQGSKATISDPEFLKRLISDAKGTGWKGVMVALPYFIKPKTQMKLHRMNLSS